MTNVNHLENAIEQTNLIDGKDMNEDIKRTQIAQSYALIAIAETNEGRLTNEIEMTAHFHIICEQLMKMNKHTETILKCGLPIENVHDQEDK